jgi:hypothetical protein
MNIENVCKTYSTETATYGANKWGQMIEDIYVPLLSSFNNISYIGKNPTGSSAGGNPGNKPSYLFSIENSPNLFLQIGMGSADMRYYFGNRLYFCTSDSLVGVNSSWYPYYQGTTPVPGDRVVQMPAGGTSSIVHRQQFKFYYLKDDNNNLKAWWWAEPSSGTNTEAYPCFITKTINNRTICCVTNSNSTMMGVYLDDPDHQVYYINTYSGIYENPNNFNQIVKSNCFFVSINSTAPGNGQAIDSICNDELFYMWNKAIQSQTIGSNGFGSANNKKLIKIGNNYYRQLSGLIWMRDWDEDDIMTNHFDPAS